VDTQRTPQTMSSPKKANEVQVEHHVVSEVPAVTEGHVDRKSC